MLSSDSEKLLTFGEVVKRLPKSRSGKSLHPNTLWRWAKKGLKAPNGELVRLEITKVGGRNCTSLAALNRFFEQLEEDETDVEPRRSSRTSRPPSSAKRSMKARQELEKLGF